MVSNVIIAGHAELARLYARDKGWKPRPGYRSWIGGNGERITFASEPDQLRGLENFKIYVGPGLCPDDVWIEADRAIITGRAKWATER